MNSSASVRGARPPVRNRTRIEPLEQEQRTLGAALSPASSRATAQFRRGLADELLRRAFTAEPTRRGARAAAALLRAHARALTAAVARALEIDRYSVEQILRMLIERSERLKLYVRGNRRDALPLRALDARAAERALLPGRDSAPAL